MSTSTFTRGSTTTSKKKKEEEQAPEGASQVAPQSWTKESPTTMAGKQSPLYGQPQETAIRSVGIASGGPNKLISSTQEAYNQQSVLGPSGEIMPAAQGEQMMANLRPSWGGTPEQQKVAGEQSQELKQEFAEAGRLQAETGEVVQNIQSVTNLMGALNNPELQVNEKANEIQTRQYSGKYSADELYGNYEDLPEGAWWGKSSPEQREWSKANRAYNNKHPSQIELQDVTMALSFSPAFGNIIEGAIGVVMSKLAMMGTKGQAALSQAASTSPEAKIEMGKQLDDLGKGISQLKSEVTNGAEKLIAGTTDDAAQAAIGKSPASITNNWNIQGGTQNIQVGGKFFGKAVDKVNSATTKLKGGILIKILKGVWKEKWLIAAGIVAYQLSGNTGGDIGQGGSMQSGRAVDTVERALRQGNLPAAMLAQEQLMNIDDIMQNIGEFSKEDSTVLNAMKRAVNYVPLEKDKMAAGYNAWENDKLNIQLMINEYIASGKVVPNQYKQLAYGTDLETLQELYNIQERARRG